MSEACIKKGNWDIAKHNSFLKLSLWHRFSIYFYLTVDSAMIFLQFVWHNPWDQNQWFTLHPSIGYRSLSGIADLSYDHLIDHPWRLFRSQSTSSEWKHRWVFWEVFTEHSLIFIEHELRYRYRIDKSLKLLEHKNKINTHMNIRLLHNQLDFGKEF